MVRLQEACLQGKELFALITSLRKSRSINTIEKLLVSLNSLETMSSVVTLCSFVREAKKLRILCTFYTGVTIEWPKDETYKNRSIIARCEKKNEVHYRLESN